MDYRDGDGILPFAPPLRQQVRFADDGAHVIRYQAFDVAGNPTAERSANFKIDQTPPNLVVFEAQNAEDPRLINVAANDQTTVWPTAG